MLGTASGFLVVVVSVVRSTFPTECLSEIASCLLPACVDRVGCTLPLLRRKSVTDSTPLVGAKQAFPPLDS